VREAKNRKFISSPKKNKKAHIMAKTVFYLGITVSIMFLVFFSSPLISWKMTAAQPLSEEEPLSLGMIADLAKPAVVQVGADHVATVSAPDWGRNTDLLQQDLETLASENDDFDLDDEQVVAEQTQALFYSDPLRYIAPSGAVRTTQAVSSGTGSGFIVTPDGYIVTNAHVVYSAEQDLQVLINSAITSFILEDLQIVFPDINLEEVQQGILTEQQAALAEAINEFYVDQYNLGMITVGDVQSSVYALSRVSIPGVVVGEKGISAEVIPHATGSPIPGKDVAVIKIEGSNLPTLPLGNETALQSLDNIIVIGFPGIVTQSGLIPQEGQEPSVTSGQFSGYQTTAGGWRAMQVQTPIAPGNSGGPALDSAGRVIGIATFRSVNPATGEASQSHNFLVPVSIVKDFLNRANVVPSEGTFTQLYRQALIHYSAGRYNEAIDILQQVNNISPNSPYVLDYISRSQAQLGSSASGGIAGNSTDNRGGNFTR
jgi:S1-C subfamily serine protease